MGRVEESSSYLAAGVDRQQALRDAGLLLLRAWLAVVFTYHGGQKLFGWFNGYGLEATAGWMGSVGIPVPKLSALVASSAELFGGWLLLVGLLSRPVAAILAFTMLVATWTHAGNGFNAATGGIEYPATWLVVLTALAFVGPGRWTLARLIAGGGRRPANAAVPASAAAA